MLRREFLKESHRAALGFSLLPLVGCSPEKDAALETLIAELGKRIPTMMEAAKVPGLSIVLVKDAQLQWRRGFGVKDSASSSPSRSPRRVLGLETCGSLKGNTDL